MISGILNAIPVGGIAKTALSGAGRIADAGIAKAQEGGGKEGGGGADFAKMALELVGQLTGGAGQS